MSTAFESVRAYMKIEVMISVGRSARHKCATV